MSKYEFMLYNKDKEGICVITFNRPPGNAMLLETHRDLHAALEEADKDCEVRVVVLTGTGQAFSAGGDVKGMSKHEVWEVEPVDMLQGLHLGINQCIRTLWNMTKPTIAMVNGDAAGAGFDIALACDLRLASTNARFVCASTRIGLFIGSGGHWFLPRIVGLTKAVELLYTGSVLTAAEAEKCGLLNKLVNPEDLEKETMGLARKLAQGPASALRYARRMIYKGLETDLDTALEVAQAYQTISMTSGDYKEGITAFAEKRAPIFPEKAGEVLPELRPY